MVENFRFGRLDRTDRIHNFTYNTHTGADAEWGQRSIDMKETGAHWSITIKNYMREDLVMVSSLRAEPTRYASIYAHDDIMLEDTNNFVIIELRYRENERSKEKGVKVKQQKRIEIRCPGHHLQTHSLFVEELGCYFTIEDRLPATRECIAQDARFPTAKEVAVPASSVKATPISTLRDFEPLLKNCIERADRIQVRVGVRVDVDPSRVPDHVKSMRIAVMDRDFSPYHCNRMRYDPVLAENEFVVENLHFVTSEPLFSTWERLYAQPARAFFLDTEEHRTMGGVLCGLVIFADTKALQDYIFAHKSEELYNELTERLIDRTGDHALRKKIHDLEAALMKRDEQINELDNTIKFEKNQSKEYKRMVTALEDTVRKLQTHHEPSFAYEAVMGDIENQRTKLSLDQDKLKHDQDRLQLDREELDRKMQMAAASHKAGMLKSAADMLKSSWGIIAIVGTVGTAVVKGWKTLKSQSA